MATFASVPKGEAGLQRLFDLYRKHGAADYIGEPISQTAHACQAGMLAELEGADPAVCIGAFLHDVGHLLACDDEFGKGLKMMGDVGVLDHENLGADLALAVGLPRTTAEIIRNHINAKRWLVTTKDGYYERLSEASKETFTYQGGKMSPEERAKFEGSDDFKSHIRMRQWDEGAKDDSARMAEKVETQYNVDHWQEMAMTLIK